MATRYRVKTKTFQVVHEPGIDFGPVTGPEDAVPLLRAIVRDVLDCDREAVLVLALNSRGRVVGYKVVGIGSHTATLVHPKQIFDVAFAFASAASLLVAHTHPSGDVTPSIEDLRLTERLVAAGELMGIPIIDHIVLASTGAPDSPWTSLMINDQQTILDRSSG